MSRSLRCFARGRDGHFEAICIDLDISIVAGSINEAQATLNAAIIAYVEDALKEEPHIARQLLSRSSPFHVRASWIVSYAWHMMFAPRRSEEGNLQASYDLACPA